jgi:hypothetical protein
MVPDIGADIEESAAWLEVAPDYRKLLWLVEVTPGILAHDRVLVGSHEKAHPPIFDHGPDDNTRDALDHDTAL